MALILETRHADGSVVRTRLQPGSNRVPVDGASSYRIFDESSNAAPTGLVVRRIDRDLVMEGVRPAVSAEDVQVTLADYYTVCSTAASCQVAIETGSAAPVGINAATQPIGALSDGSFILYDPTFVPTTPPAGLGESVPVRAILYGVGGLAVVGLAAGAGGGGDDGRTAVSGTGQRTPDAELKVTSLPFVNTRFPVITGEGEPGARVVVQLDGDGDGRADVGYSTIVGDDFRWRVNLATDAPVQGSLSPQGLPDSSVVRVSQSIGGGEFQNLPLYTLTFDNTPPARAVIDPVAGDNIVTAPEKNAGVAVSGTAEANGTVLVTWGQVSKISAVDSAGRWSAGFGPAEIPSDGQTPITAVARDVAGNSAVAAQSAVTVNTRPFPLEIGVVAGDDRVNAAEAARLAIAGISEARSSINIVWQGVVKPTVADEAGNWSVIFTAAEVPSTSDPSGPTSPSQPMGSTRSATPPAP
jgi:hypothetical protein